MIVGIDSGLSGGLVALSRLPGVAPVAMLPMPCRKEEGGREIDVLHMVWWLASLNHGGDGLVIGVEEPMPHGMSSGAVQSMWYSFGLIVGALRADGRWPVTPVTCGNRTDGWQRGMLGTVPQGKTKEYALAAAQSIWPSEQWRASPRCSTPHDGMVDAALIAEFLRRKLSNPTTT